MVKEKYYFAVVTLATWLCPWNSILCPFGKSSHLFRQKFVFSKPVTKHPYISNSVYGYLPAFDTYRRTTTLFKKKILK